MKEHQKRELRLEIRLSRLTKSRLHRIVAFNKNNASYERKVSFADVVEESVLLMHDTEEILQIINNQRPY